jgi:hypothetical protein
MFHPSRCTPVLIMLAMLLTSCQNNPPDGAPAAYSKRVGPKGATINDPGGCTLTIPAGALAESTTISVTTYQNTVDLGTSYGVLPGALCGVLLEPDGTTFLSPVTVQIVPSHALEPGSYPIFTYDAVADKWVETVRGQTPDDGSSITMEVSHFSSYSVFDMPYGILDGFPTFATEHATSYPEDSPATYGELWVKGEVFEEESFAGPDQYYDGCCYMRAGAKVHVEYRWDGTPYTYDTTFGDANETSYVLSYSYSGERLAYSIDLTVYLDCSNADGVFVAGASERTLEKGESTKVYAILECGDEPIPDRVVTFALSGPGKLSSSTALTNEEGEASVTYSATDDGNADVTASLDGCSCAGSGTAEDSVTITVGKDEEQPQEQRWSGTLAYEEIGWTGVTGCASVATYDASFQFTVAGEPYPSDERHQISGEATAAQAVTFDPDEDFPLVSQEVPGSLSLTVSGWYDPDTGNVDVALRKEDSSPFYTYVLDESVGGGDLEEYQGIRVIWFGSDLFSEYAVPLAEGTYSGSSNRPEWHFGFSYTVTLVRED